ncbi:phenylacetate--CoA ligase family protein [Methylicorpusculum sp.]|uniref:phenylacetate--CoA ligase family protein n=1 Tax=Methylicorpusculum sp. TaxID=2713644 RepID=UPI00273203C4|nr:AMP-binding protein [Methylicorpusculum sp.]MDP2177465.1 AMP-binding protein [Methylicorpusculum sp.]MDP3530221.1 AMP-binding protein [Methylicorpusculum sp.]MDZ4154391.1 AMP-binding protein [Methylicorpusculum sp.]
MNCYTNWVTHVVFPVHEWLKKHTTVAVRKDMEKTQWLAASDLKKRQLENLKSFLKEVEQRVPYYRNLFKTLNFDPNNLNSLKELSHLPLTDKSIIRQHSDELKAFDATGLSRFNTGGSSGEPLVFYIGKNRVSHDVAAKWRATRWWGVDIGDPEIVVWGSPIELGKQDRIKLIRDKLLRTHLLPAFEMSEAKLDEFVQHIQALKPKMLFGYPSALAHIARHAQKHNKKLNDLGIKVAFVTSERLYDHQREMIETTFGCPVANGYGGRDAGFIAHQCPAGGMHITAEDIIVEIIDKQGQVLPVGEEGEIVITHLATADFPFIRYRTGDIAKLSNDLCVCGRGLPLLKDIQGRTTDFVVAKDGTVLHGLALIYVLRDLPGIGGFKIIQTSLDETRIQIARDQGYDPACEEAIQQTFKKRLGSDVAIHIDYVDHIEKEKSGKFRYVVSHVELKE